MSLFPKLFVCAALLCVSCTQQAVISLRHEEDSPLEDILLVVTTPGSAVKKHKQTGIVYRETPAQHYDVYLGPTLNRPKAPTFIELPNTCDSCEVVTYWSMKRKPNRGEHGDSSADKKSFIPCKTEAIHIDRDGKLKIIPKRQP